MLRIILDQPGRPYRPGDTITGTIENAGRETFNRVSITLEGRAKTKWTRRRGQNRHTFRSRALLCFERQAVSPDANGSLRFEVVIPTKSPDPNDRFDRERLPLSNGYWDSSWSPERHFAGSGAHALPPTMSQDVEGIWRTMGEMYIEYKLTANMDGGGTIQTGSSGVSRTFWLTTACPSPEELEKMQNARTQGKCYFEVRTLKLLPENTSRDLTLKEKWKNAVSSEVPELGFDAKIDVSKYIHTGDPLNLHISVSPPRTNGIGPAEANLAMTSIAVELEATLSARANTTFSTTVNEKSHIVFQETLVKPPNREIFGPENGGFSRVKSLSSLRINVPPSFATYNIARTYRVKIRAKFVCAGEIKEWSQWYPIKVLSRSSGLPSYQEVMNGTEEAGGSTEDWGPCPKFKNDDF